MKSQNKVDREKKVGYFQKDGLTTTIYIGNLNYKKTEFDIKQMFEKFGKVKYVKLVTDPKTKKNKGIAFVQMPNKKKAELAIESLNGKEIDGRTLKVSIAEERKSMVPENRPKKEKKIIEAEPTFVKKPKVKKGLAKLFDYKQKNS